VKRTVVVLLLVFSLLSISVSAQRIPPACSTDLDCTLPETCNYYGDYYGFEGYYCGHECFADDDCGPGFICLLESGNCIPENGNGCETDDDCDPGFICDDNECIPDGNGGCPSVEGNCFEPHDGFGCNDLCDGGECSGCCDTVCADDPFCCDVAFDSICSGSAESLCIGNGCETNADCGQDEICVENSCVPDGNGNGVESCADFQINIDKPIKGVDPEQCGEVPPCINDIPGIQIPCIIDGECCVFEGKRSISVFDLALRFANMFNAQNTGNTASIAAAHQMLLKLDIIQIESNYAENDCNDEMFIDRITKRVSPFGTEGAADMRLLQIAEVILGDDDDDYPHSDEAALTAKLFALSAMFHTDNGDFGLAAECKCAGFKIIQEAASGEPIDIDLLNLCDSQEDEISCDDGGCNCNFGDECPDNGICDTCSCEEGDVPDIDPGEECED